MSDVAAAIRRASEKCGFSRDRYAESRIPTDMSNVVVLPLFPDLRHTFAASSLILKRFREEDRGSKYFILCSWPGCQDLFPHVDEYWSVQDGHAVKKMYSESHGFSNNSNILANCVRNLNSYFFDVVDPSVFSKYYTNGLRHEFFKHYGQVRRTLPMVPSAGALSKELNRELANRAGYKIFIYPSQWMRTWSLGSEKILPTHKTFWVSLVNKLLKNKYVPVVYKHPWTHDLSPDFPDECVHVSEPDFGKVLGVMRSVGCVLDVFNGISRLALAARCPFVCCDERSRYANTRDWEIDDLCGAGVPRQYIFSFCTTLDGMAGVWDDALLGGIIGRLDKFLPELNRDTWPSTAEVTEVVSYDIVRKKKIIKVGAKLFKAPRE